MSKIPKRVLLTLSSFLIAGLLLAGTVSVLAATSFSLVGTLNYVGTTYSVDSQVITVPQTTVCTDLTGATVTPCSVLQTKKVEATGVVSGTVYTATAIAELGTHVGSVTVINTGVTPNLWTVGGMVFQVSSNTVLSGTFAVGDVAEVTYKKVGAANVAVEVNPVEMFTFTGKVSAMGATWSVGDKLFVANADTLVYDGAALNDIVTVTYYVLDANNIAVKIELYAPSKNENSRCEGRAEDFPIPPGILKKLPEDVDEVQVRAMFCQGFGWGEIVLAFKYGQGDLTPAELLALRVEGKGWGQIKKEAAPLSEGGNQNFQTQSGKPENPGNSDHSKNNPGKGKGKNK